MPSFEKDTGIHEVKSNMGANWTEQQLQAITATGSDILVSAAAGSGKTAVLVERIIRRITQGDPPLDIDRLLVVTFTRAAAAEMSQRIGAAVAKQLEANPENVHLQNQLTYLGHADIKTIHAFCLQVIREYGYLLDIDPAAQTADPSEIHLLQKDVLTELFESKYEAEDNDFLLLLETFGEATGDNRLKELILQTYEFAQGYPNPSAILEDMAAQFDFSETDSINTCRWLPLIQESILHQAQYAFYLLQKVLQRIASDPDFTGYTEHITEEAEGLSTLAQSLQMPDYAAWHTAFASISFGRIPSYRGENKELAEWAKNLRNEAKKVVEGLKDTYFCYGVEKQSELLHKLYPVANALSQLTIAFAQAFAEAKKEKLWLDFHDYEHFALQILVEPESTPQQILPTNAAKQMQERYEEIMIDEYQDSNLVQEMLLCAVSKESLGKNNRFMVGDVKQSIYRFRLAMPELFNEKYHTYPTTAGGKTRKIILSKNFRSRENILLGINFIFQQLMRESLGDVAYDEASALYYGADYPETQNDTNELLLLDLAIEENNALPEDIAELDRKTLEATWIAKKINSMIAEGFSVYERDTKQYRPLEYRDIAILFRSIKNWGTTLDDVFRKEGIPFYAENAISYYEIPEVDTILHFLRLIDNPYQDIPLLSLLHAPLYGLSADDLAEIRLLGGNGLYYECVLRYLAEGSNPDIIAILQRFYDNLQDWRTQAKQVSLQELLRYLYAQTGYYDYIGMTEGGSLRQANLRLLLEKAEAYEKNSGKGLFHFIRFVEDMKTMEQDISGAKLQSESENLVRIMTIHKSKGLEFPVVFVADLGKQFNEMDIRNPILTHQHWGYGMDYTDIEKRVTYRTLSKTALAEAIRLENLSEEMRVLYVALTRAKEKLILTGSVKNLSTAMQKWAETADTQDSVLPLLRLRRGRTYLDWIMPALLRHPAGRSVPEPWEVEDRGEPHIFFDEHSKWDLTFWNRQQLLEKEEIQTQEAEEKKAIFTNWDTQIDYSGLRSDVFHILSWQYDHANATKLPAKISISEIKRKFMEQIYDIPPASPAKLTLPTQIMQPLQAAQIGTAMHMVMEAADLRQSYTEETLEILIQDLITQGRLTELEADALRRNELLQFFSSDIAQRIRQADSIHKEQPFSMLIQPHEIALCTEPMVPAEWVQVNGIIDCYFQEQNDIILVDYKSDHIYQENLLIEKYKLQINLYREALRRATGMPVSQCYLYSFAMGRAIAVPNKIVF